MKLKNWCNKDEKISTEIRKEYWKMEVGKKYSEKKIAELEKVSAEHSRVFLKNFKKPRELYEGSVGSLASEQVYPLMLELNKARKEKIVSSKHKLKGKPVTWQTWRQFVVDAKDSQRKQVFDEFIKKAPLLDGIIQKRFDLSADILGHYNLEPLKLYLEDHNMSLGKLRSVVNELSDGTRTKFQKQWSQYSQKFLGRKQRYYDDLYFIRNKIFEDLVPKFKHVKPLKTMHKTMKDLGFSNKYITLDDADREGKFASPFCSAVKVPTDVRVSFKAENPLQTTESLYHEYGHAMHESNISPSTHYWQKGTSEGLAETFSTLFEYLLQDEVYLTEVLKLSPETAKTLKERSIFSELFAINFYAANSMFRIDYWDKKVPFDKCNALYAKHIKHYMNINMPGAYWKLHHILPDSLMYVPSYLLAMTNSYNVTQELRDEFGIRWWKERKAGDKIKSYMKPGSKSKLAYFSNLKTKNFVKYLND